MAQITIDRDAYLKLKSGEATLGDDKLSSFLVNRFEESEQAARVREGNEADWTYVIWEYRF